MESFPRLAISKNLETLAKSGAFKTGTFKRIAEQARIATQNGAFDGIAERARELTEPNRGLLREAIDTRRTVEDFHEKQREMSLKMARRRRAIEEATLDTPEVLRTLVELEIAGRQEARKREDLIIRIALSSLFVAIAALLIAAVFH
jgi:hypothetical protein